MLLYLKLRDQQLKNYLYYIYIIYNRNTHKESKHNTGYSTNHKEAKEERCFFKKKELQNNQKTIKMPISTYLSIITLNVNGLSAQSKESG